MVRIRQLKRSPLALPNFLGFFLCLKVFADIQDRYWSRPLAPSTIYNLHPLLSAVLNAFQPEYLILQLLPEAHLISMWFD